MTVTINGNGTITPTSAIQPTGSILQVVQTLKNDTFTTTSTSFTDITGLSVSITPASASNKILVSFSVDHSNTNNQSCRVSVFTGSTNLLGSDVSNRLRGLQCYTWGDINTSEQANFEILHSPSTTSAITYQVKMAVQGDTGCINRSGSDSDNTAYGYRSASSITAMEVAA
jgi:hypothetical protein